MASQPVPATPWYLLPFEWVGEVVLFWWATLLAVFDFLGDLLVIFGKTVYYIARGYVRIQLTLAQMAFLGVDSLGIVLLCVGFTGMTLAQVLLEQVAQLGVGKEFVGAGMMWAMTKELAPVLSGLILAGRAGAGMASEIGTMKVTEQLDALRATGVHPIRYIAVPRLLALLIMCPLVTFAAAVVGTVAGYIPAANFDKVPLTFLVYFDGIRLYWSMELLETLLKKSVVFGLVIAVVAVAEGFRTEGGAAGVGQATTRAVVNSMILIFAADLILTIFFKV